MALELSRSAAIASGAACAQQANASQPATHGQVQCCTLALHSQASKSAPIGHGQARVAPHMYTCQQCRCTMAMRPERCTQVLFADVVSYTSMSQELEAEQARAPG